VSNLRIVPDSISGTDLSPDQVQDTTAQVPISVAAGATDADGWVERVVFSIEPASRPRATAVGRLDSLPSGQYGRTLRLGIPATVSEIYTVRVYAVDNDSLASNQVVGQLRFVPGEGGEE